MIKYLLFFIFIVKSFADNYYDNNSSLITNYDLKLMNQYDKLVYELSDTQLSPLDIDVIYNFIKIHKRYIIDYSLAKINFNAVVGVDDYDYVNDNERDKNYKKASIQFNYPLFDRKIQKDIRNKKMEYNFKILNEIKKYANLRDKKIAFMRKLKFQRLIQIKEKLQVKKGVKYLDDRLKTIEKLLNIQNDILNIQTNLLISQKILLNYVKRDYKEELKRMLK
jgi:hypothetical protein